MRHEIHQQDDTVKTTLMDIASVEQVKQYLRGPLINAIFGDQESTASGPFDVGYIMTDARMLGAARNTSIRVATNSCTVSQFQNLVPTCYAKLSDGRRRANIYGENLGGGMRRSTRRRISLNCRTSLSSTATCLEGIRWTYPLVVSMRPR